MTETIFENSHILCVITVQDIHILLCLNTTESHLALFFDEVYIRTVLPKQAKGPLNPLDYSSHWKILKAGYSYRETAPAYFPSL